MYLTVVYFADTPYSRDLEAKEAIATDTNMAIQLLFQVNEPF